MRVNLININNKQNFKGYDARPLKAIAITQPGYKCQVARELDEIAKATGFNVEVLTEDKLKPLSYIDEVITPVKKNLRIYYETLLKHHTAKPMSEYKVIFHKPQEANKETRGFKYSRNTSTWAQDSTVVAPNGKVLASPDETLLATNIARYHGKTTQVTPDFAKGGNLFFVRSKGKEELLAGRNCRKKFMNEDGQIDYKKLKELYGVNKITFLPQMDFHLDLSLRPLDKKRVLITDDNLTLQMLEEGKAKLQKAVSTTEDPKKKQSYEKILKNIEQLKSNFETQRENNKFAPPSRTDKILRRNGYKTLHVPGRIYHAYLGEDPIHSANFMNAIVTLNKNNELVYITNHSLIDDKLGISSDIAQEIGFSIEDAFKKSISKYVKPSNVFFLKGAYSEISEYLAKKHGGIHCLVTEIPWQKKK